MFEIVRYELNKTDPMQLCPGFVASIDENDPETRLVLTKIVAAATYVELAKEISNIFHEMFGESFPEKMFFSCAQNILERINKL